MLLKITKILKSFQIGDLTVSKHKNYKLGRTRKDVEYLKQIFTHE
jgi:hypothetical protein